MSEFTRTFLAATVGALFGAGSVLGAKWWLNHGRSQMQSGPQLQVGQLEEWQRFSARNPGFVAELPNLHSLARQVFERGMPKDKDDLVVFGLGLLCWEDFEEMVTLAANGHGFGALKILRGMFERMATVSYLQNNPTEIEAFREYEPIRSFKALNDAKEQFGKEFIDFIDEDTFNEAKAERDKRKERFTQDCCDTAACKRRKIMISWTPKSVLDLAKASDEGLRKQAFMLYYFGMFEAHPSFTAITSRMSQDADGRFTFLNRDDNSTQRGDLAIGLAHNLTLFNFGVQIDHFKGLTNLQPELDRAKGRMLRAWNKGTTANHNPPR